jgi:putative NADH-flavin reductase
MQLTVFGASGATGKAIVRQAAADGNAVTAAVRNPATVAFDDPNVFVAQCDVTVPEEVERVVQGSDAVLSALGTRALNMQTHVYSQGSENILSAMQDAGVRRFIGITAMPVGEPENMLERYVFFPLLYGFFGAAYADMKRMEEIVEASDCEWTIFRPARLVDGGKSSKYQTSRADLAEAMLASIPDPELMRHAVAIVASTRP